MLFCKFHFILAIVACRRQLAWFKVLSIYANSRSVNHFYEMFSRWKCGWSNLRKVIWSTDQVFETTLWTCTHMLIWCTLSDLLFCYADPLISDVVSTRATLDLLGFLLFTFATGSPQVTVVHTTFHWKTNSQKISSVYFIFLFFAQIIVNVVFVFHFTGRNQPKKYTWKNQFFMFNRFNASTGN